MIPWAAERRARLILDRVTPVWTVAAEQVQDLAGVVSWDVALFREGVRITPIGPNLTREDPAAEMARLELVLDAVRLPPMCAAAGCVLRQHGADRRHESAVPYSW